jgi:hypothetical protein
VGHDRAALVAHSGVRIDAMWDLGSANDPSSFVGYQVARSAGRTRGRGPQPQGGCGCLALLIGAIIGLIVAFVPR